MTEEVSSGLFSSQFYTQGSPGVKAVGGMGQVCPLLVQIKILRAGEKAPKDRCRWVSEKRTCPCLTHGPVQEWLGDWKTEKVYPYVSAFPGAARDSPHQGKKCQGYAGCGVTEKAKL